jgi:hypothetical protein
MSAKPAAPHERARQLVEQAVAKHAEAWAAKIGTKATAQFIEGVAEALYAMSRLHIAHTAKEAGQHRRYERASDLRVDFLEAAERATAAAKKLRNLQTTLNRLPPMQHDPGFRIHSPIAMAHDLDVLAEAARRQADKCKRMDRGGPTPMRSFEALADNLVHTYRRATGLSGAGHGARQGHLLDLVEAVLPTASEIAERVTGKPMMAPADEALGEHLHRIAQRVARRLRVITPR